MIRTPFTFAQASVICRDYQHLCGRVIDPQVLGKGYVECVAVAPFDEAKKWLFAQYYKDNRDPVKSLRFYKGQEYDVIILSFPLLRKRGVCYADLRTFVAEHHIPYDPVYYEKIRSALTDGWVLSRYT
jgi:hypothetical protein